MIEKLEMFLALARERHFGRAAEECGVTQPTLSAAIKQLEDQLGALLVLRGSRFQGFTAEGLRVLDWARRIVGDARAMQEELKAARHGLTGHVHIAAIPTAMAVVPLLTRPFCDQNPQVTVTVSSRTSIEILSMLENLEIDVGITYLDNEPLGRVARMPLYRERYRLVMAAGFPDSPGDPVGWDEVGSLPLCLLTQDMQNRRILDARLAGTGAGGTPILESDSLITLMAHVRTGRWASVMPESLIEIFGAADGLKSVPIVDPGPGHLVGLVVARREPHRPAIAALLALAGGLARDPGIDR
ncbi:LysR family transcriptional regulator [Polymorphum gilvum]|uniref:Probable transcriptional regulator protein, LysR family n=1 Tax=Polymorphum gilvum (strain LMG 25793 / CGMCC 1.9160 / SL003B-26A1) TaxID=991905 RepID=F2IY48_POLGS|nr:LysR family transcriptional regulator [Polymorphum gilvum]ADZ70551.1 Probable transcriptional regulator protein, LysR family [Polymorphum gilvum SL003B-26A1]